MINIDKLEAGPELDALVAEKVFGKKVHWRNDKWPFIKRPSTNWEFLGSILGCLPPECPPRLPRFSEDIAAAWEVVEKLLQMGMPVDLSSSEKGVHKAKVWTNSTILTVPWQETAPLAICRAALKAVEKA